MSPFSQCYKINGGETDSRYIERLNNEAEDGIKYKVLWIARHGQGVHNVVCFGFSVSSSLFFPFSFILFGRDVLQDETDK